MVVSDSGLYCLVVFIFFILSASAAVRRLVLPGLHDRAGKRGWNWRAGEWADRCCKGIQAMCFPVTPLQWCCVCPAFVSNKAVALQTEGFDGFTFELWSQLGGNKRKWVTLSTPPVFTTGNIASLREMIQIPIPLCAGSSSIWWSTSVRLWRRKDSTAFLSFLLLWQGELNRFT